LNSQSGTEVPAADYGRLSGHAFPGGTALVPAWMNRLWADAVSAPDPSPHVHPLLVYYAAVEGSGVGFGDIFELMDAPADSGIVVGEQVIEIRRPIEVGRTYTVSGGITEVVRKEGQRIGVFDMLTFVLELTEPGRTDAAAVSTMTFMFPRRPAEQA
jgi:hypothetical protein